MHNNSKRISANEINRYIYCNYQWYYRRYYGDKTLSKLRKEKNKELGIESDSRNHAFIKGSKFHKAYHRWYKVKKIIAVMILILSILVLFFIWNGFKLYGVTWRGLR